RGGDRQSVVNGVGIDQYVANWQLLHLDGQPMKADEVPLARAIRYGETCRREFIIRRAIDDDRVVAANAAPIRDDKGNVVAGIVVFVDITDRVQAEESLRLQSEELARANTEVTRFVYTVSHDLKSPLVTIKTFLGYMEKDLASNDTERMAKDMAYAHTAADKMSGLLDELLELSRVGRKVAPFAEVPLQAIVKEAMDLVAGRIAQRGVSVEVTAGPILLFGDRRRLMEVYQNLLDNAAKFMGDQPTPRVEIGAEVNDDETVLFVRDNGIGIDPRHKARLFGLFEKLNPHTEGHGMGLAMVRRIVEMHGGKIWVESDGVGKGTTFRFTLAKATVTGKDTSHDQR
ncbi:MAG: ATP-binding protein, partial [Planctomycetota bacterium]